MRDKMFLWILISNVLPTKDRIGRFIDNVDEACPPRGKDIESAIHLFCYCEFARSLWFGSIWGLKISEMQFISQRQFVEFVINPPVSLVNEQKQRNRFTPYGALLLELMWRTRNRVILEGKILSIEDLHRGLNKVFLEHLSVIEKNPKARNRQKCEWSKLEQGCIKINCDAAIGNSFSVLVIVARDWRGNLVFAHSKKAYANVPFKQTQR
jgi:hypothetical protein